MTLEPRLSQLERADLIRLAQQVPEVEYIFRHGLIYDAAYGSLLKHDRRALHRAIGETVERLYPAQLDALAPVLARHFAEAEEPAKALGYAARAGTLAAARHASAEAVMHFEYALRLIGVLGDTALPADVSPTAIYLGLGRALEMTGRYPDAERTYQTLEALARSRDDRAAELAALAARATIHAAPTSLFDASLARTLSERCLDIARELGDRAAEARAYWNLLLAARFTGDLADAAADGERAVALARELNLRELLAFALNDLAPVYASLGDGVRSTAASRRACDLFRALGNLPMLCDSLNNVAEVEMLSGMFDRALLLMREAHDVARSIGNIWGESYSQAHLGFLAMERGNMAEALDAIDSAVRLGQTAGFAVADMFDGFRASILGFLGDGAAAYAVVEAVLRRVERRLPAFRSIAQTMLGLALVQAGRVDEGRPLIRAGEDSVELADLGILPTVLDALGEFAVMEGDAARASAIGRQALDFGERIGIRILVPTGYLYEGLSLQLAGKLSDSYAMLLQGRDVAREIGARRRLLPLAMALATVAAALGRADDAATHRKEAREVATYIADHAPAALRATFLARPEVKAVFA